jgi:hypothetical protein
MSLAVSETLVRSYSTVWVRPARILTLEKKKYQKNDNDAGRRERRHERPEMPQGSPTPQGQEIEANNNPSTL